MRSLLSTDSGGWLITCETNYFIRDIDWSQIVFAGSAKSDGVLSMYDKAGVTRMIQEDREPRDRRRLNGVSLRFPLHFITDCHFRAGAPCMFHFDNVRCILTFLMLLPWVLYPEQLKTACTASHSTHGIPRSVSSVQESKKLSLLEGSWKVSQNSSSLPS